MMKLLHRILGRTRTAAMDCPTRAWTGCGESHYIWHYRGRIEDVARALLFNHNWRGDLDNFLNEIRMRFNSRTGYAELFTQNGKLLARVRVEGECGTPTTAIVDTALSDRDKALFTDILSLPVCFRALV